MTALEALQKRRLARWRQTPVDRIPDAEAAVALIDRVGLATLYPASPELPNLFHAYVGTPDAATDSGWDTPSGHVYAWRWEIGRTARAFYTALVRSRPTWVSWPLLPAVLRLRGALDAAEDLYEAGRLSADARRIVEVLDTVDALDTGDLRRTAGFPTGKSSRAAYLKAVAELENQLVLAKVFAPDEGNDNMAHALVRRRYPAQVAAAEGMSRPEALDRVLATYLPAAVYAGPKTLAKALKLPEPELREGLERLRTARLVETCNAADVTEPLYVWRE